MCLLAAECEAPMWTDYPPDDDGFYWIRLKNGRYLVCEVLDGQVFMLGWVWNVGTMECEWWPVPVEPPLRPLAHDAEKGEQ